MIVRNELPTDIPAIYAIQSAAFGKRAEADLVDGVRLAGGVRLSLVAERAGELVGHVLFSAGMLVTPAGNQPIITLGPVAVLPSQQNQRIGTTLIETGLAQLQAEGHGLVAVLGHPTYYPRFGFVPSVRYGIGSEYDVPDEVFMVWVARPDTVSVPAGKIVYHPAFRNL